MKRILVILLMLLIVLSSAGCGVKEKVENKVGEKITEKVLEKAVGDKDTKVDISEGQITIKDKDGNEATFGGTEWPDIDSIPEFKKGNIMTVMQSDKNTAMILIEEVEKEDFENYWEDIKELFTENNYEMTAEDVLVFTGENSEKYAVQLTYDIANKSMSIYAGVNE